METAEKLLSADFSAALREHLDKGLSFPAARQAALGSDLLTRPNDILAVEYCKAMLSQNSSMKPFVIHREGSYHADTADSENPSATAVRQLMLESGAWLDYVPAEARDCFKAAPIHTLQAGEKAILARLRCMTEAEFEALPHGSEGLWRKFMHAVSNSATVEEILNAAKSKRYTRTRLDRMLMCAFLGITREMMLAATPYVRVLAFNGKGREILKTARKHSRFINAGEDTKSDHQSLEERCGDLYALFSSAAEAPGIERKRRVEYIP